MPVWAIKDKRENYKDTKNTQEKRISNPLPGLPLTDFVAFETNGRKCRTLM